MTWGSFPHYWPFVKENHYMDSPHKGLVTQNCDIFLVVGEMVVILSREDELNVA